MLHQNDRSLHLYKVHRHTSDIDDVTRNDDYIVNDKRGSEPMMDILGLLGNNVSPSGIRTIKSAVADDISNLQNEKLDTYLEKQAFRQDIYDQIAALPWKSNVNVSVQISDKAFDRMMVDEEFKNYMMDRIKEATMIGFPGYNSFTWIDENGYRTVSYHDPRMGQRAFGSISHQADTFFTQKSDTDYLDDIWEEARLRRKEIRELREDKIRKNKMNYDIFFANSRYEDSMIFVD